MSRKEQIMQSLATFVIRYHKIILLVAGVLLILSIIAAGNIQSKTEIKDLLSEKDPMILSYLEIDSVFAGGATVMVTIEGADKARMMQCAEEFVAEFRRSATAMQLTKAINLKVDREFITNWGLLLQKPKDIEKTRRNFSQLNLLPFITALNNSFEETYTGEEAGEELETSKQEKDAVAMLDQLETFVTQLRTFLANPDTLSLEAQGKILAETFIYGSGYNFNHDNSMLLFTITPDFNLVEIDKITALMSVVKEIKKQLNERYPDLQVNYTGDVAIQGDEQDALGFDMLVPSLVALILILLLFIFSFNQLRSIIFIVVTLIVGVIYNYGFLGVTIEEINMLTSIMSVLLIGLGVDYGIQIITNFTAYRAEGYAPAEAVRLTYQKAGMGTFLAALTTALAFFVLSATGVRAFAQFGLVMGTGIINCFIAMFLVLPALLLWWGKKDVRRTHLPNLNYAFLAQMGTKLHRRSWWTLAVSGIITLLLFFAMFQNRMDYDMMNLEPQDMPSIVQYKRVMDKFDMTPFASMVIAQDIEEARYLTENLEKAPLVAEINSIAYYLPTEQEQEERLVEIRKIRQMPPRYTRYTYTTEELQQFVQEIQRLEWNIIELGDLSVAGLGEDNKIVQRRNAMIREIIGAEVGQPGREVFQQLIRLLERDPKCYAARLERLDPYFARTMDSIVTKMAQVNRKMGVNDLPAAIRDGMLDKAQKRSLIMFYPEKGVMEDIDRIKHFNSAVARVSPKITGTPQVLVAWLNEVLTASWKAGLYVFLAVLFFLILSFRDIKHTLIAITPLVIGMIWGAGLYALSGELLNVVNIAVIPLIIGMGIDYGIHIVHRFKVERDVASVYRYTGKGVLLSALTTMIGFGSLGLVGRFGSVNTMGRILFIGITACLLTALIVLPALLALDSPQSKQLEKNKD